MLKSGARGVRSRWQAEWEWRQARDADADDDASVEELRQDTMWDAEISAVARNGARRSRLKGQKSGNTGGKGTPPER